MIKHFATCRADYPEKVPGELPQQIVEIEGIKQCVDCGAFELDEDNKTHVVLGVRILRRDNKIARLQRRIKALEAKVQLYEGAKKYQRMEF